MLELVIQIAFVMIAISIILNIYRFTYNFKYLS